MQTFLQWAEAKGYKVVFDAPEAQPTKGENRVRTGLTQNYPDAYLRSQYPGLALTPHKATAALDLQQKPATGYAGPKAAK